MNNQFTGWLGEKATAWGLSQGLDPQYYWRVDDLIIPDGMGGTSQIDHAIVSPFGIFVIEVKNRSGLIIGTVDQSTWRQISNGKSYEFQNPLVQNDSHIRALGRLLNFPKSFFHSIVFFCGSARLASPLPFNVRVEGVTTVVHSRRQIILWPDEVNHSWHLLWECKNNHHLSPGRHVQNVNTLRTKLKCFTKGPGA